MQKVFAYMAAMGIVGSLALSAQAATDLAGADMTVTSLVGDEVFENSSATAATLTLDLADDVTWTGSVSGPVLLVKTGAGTLTVDGDGYQGTGGVQVEEDMPPNSAPETLPLPRNVTVCAPESVATLL